MSFALYSTQRCAVSVDLSLCRACGGTSRRNERGEGRLWTKPKKHAVRGRHPTTKVRVNKGAPNPTSPPSGASIPAGRNKFGAGASSHILSLPLYHGAFSGLQGRSTSHDARGPLRAANPTQHCARHVPQAYVVTVAAAAGQRAQKTVQQAPAAPAVAV